MKYITNNMLKGMVKQFTPLKEKAEPVKNVEC